MRAALLSVALAALVAVPAIAQQRAPAPGAAQQQGPRRLGDFQDWTAAVHTEAGQKVCYAFTRAQRSDPARDGVILTVTHRASSRDQVAISAGYAYPRNAAVTVNVGQRELAFYTGGSSAFARDGRAAVAAFRGGANAVSRGPRAGGRGTASDTFSLSGFSAAYDAISQECPAPRR
jgi:invasion protein IalB